MILVDIGNTSSHFGIEAEGKIVSDFRIANEKFKSRRLPAALRNSKRDEMLVCSVAPSVTAHLEKTGLRFRQVGKDIKVPIRCRYARGEIGQDRLVDAFAAKNLYPDARLIVDFGTAITIDVISDEGTYEGGFILPGIHLYLRSLAQCELLKGKVRLAPARGMIPRNTRSSISKGVLEGFSLMINGFIKKYTKTLKIGRSASGIILTGGEATLLKGFLRFDYLLDPLLTLKGLLLLSRKISR